MPTPLEIASGMLGKSEGPDRAALQDYLQTGGANLDPATTAWCAAFVNSALQQSGMKGTGSNLARSFLDYGQPIDKPERGDIAVFSRGDPKGPYGHVGFFEGYGPDGKINVLGGNQSDSVSVAGYDAANLLGFRRPGGAPTMADAQAGKFDPVGEVMANNGQPPVMGSMAPAQSTQTSSAAIPLAVQSAAGSAPKSMNDIFGMMAAAPQQGPQFSPVQIAGPSPGQANALSSLIQALKGRMA
ncbi:TIGR02594 family protein [Rhizobium leguminosarum]|uniref:TIGR02594 family protein n=1 Tax=Rhizobium leguminosarum TaxID=384 RepID=UPI001C946C81|nr:TIGR02594 family protein [Rhizobium leguminosarum]MBY5821489.1 TIGR02594 family protein [Rhizobium leguminosarum]